MARLSLALLGPPEVALVDRPINRSLPNKVLALLAYLAVEADRPQRRDALATLIWPNRPDRAARASLRKALYALRRVIGDTDADPPYLHITRETIQFNTDSNSWVDVLAFRAFLAPQRSGVPTIAHLEEAATLYRGRFLEGFSLRDSLDFDDWLSLTQEQLHRQALSALEHLAGQYERLGQLARACEVARRWVQLEPWREEPNRDLMRLLALTGQRGAALRQYEVLEQVLQEELGVAPDPKTTALYTAILEGRVAAPPSSPSDTIPDQSQHSGPMTFAQPPPVSRDEIPRERRVVTILYSDIMAASSMAEQLDPEEFTEVMKSAQDVRIKHITRYQGTIARLTDDTILAYFGAPVAHEDDAERACRAALEIVGEAQSTATRLARERGLSDVEFRVAVHTGLVVGREVVFRTWLGYAAMGGAVRAVAGVGRIAHPGTVLITEDVHTLIAPLFETEPLGAVEVEGRGVPVGVYRLLGPQEIMDKGRGIEGLGSSLVGREAEFENLQEVLERLQAGVGGIVTLVGEAGIGKSRLVAELRTAMASANLQWVEGRCLAYDSITAYSLWKDALRSVLAISADETPDVLEDALRQLLETLCPDHFDDVFPYLARVMSLPTQAEEQGHLRHLEGGALRRNTFRAVEMVLQCSANERPLVLVCEDLHWADSTSLELLEHLLALTDRASLLIICVFRPHRDHGCWTIRETAGRLYDHRHIDLRLNPLTSQESRTLLGNLLNVEIQPAELEERILSHAEGNPFYMEEILRSLINSKAIVCDRATGRCWVVQNVKDIPIPDTLQGVITARIDRLQEGPRRVLQLASVIGRIFTHRVLSAIVSDGGQLDRNLVALQREEMVRERARMPDLEYIFKHHLTQEAAYRSLLRSDRRVFHRQVAEAVEQMFHDRIDEHLELLGRHWERAGELEKAVHYLHRAGDHAAQQFSTTEALEHYSHALDLMSQKDLRGRYDLLLARERLYELEGDRDAQQADLTTLEALVAALEDSQKRAEVALRQARHTFLTGHDYGAAIAVTQVAIRRARAARAEGIEAAAHRLLGEALSDQGEYEGARSAFERALGLARAAGLRAEEARSLLGLGAYVCQRQGDYAGYGAYTEDALNISREIGYVRGERESLSGLGIVALAAGDLDQAHDYCQQALQLCRRMGDRYAEGWKLFQLGTVFHHLGDYGRARTTYERALDIIRETGHPRGEGTLLAYLGLASHHLGDDETARDHCRRATRIGRDADDPSIQAQALTFLGDALMGLGLVSEAADAYRQALALRRKLGEQHWAVESLAGVAQVALMQGDLSQAQAHVEEILSYLQARTLGGLFEPFRVYLTCYRVLHALGDPRAQAVLGIAYERLQECAETIGDEDAERVFLEDVAAHKEIIHEWTNRH